MWCDGIQRVVCGVTPTTTCQDIVFALAHATAQTGRFILIEQWRNSERVLAPSDWPLASLSKWGEFAGDVTFIMKRSGDVANHTKPKTLDLSHGKHERSSQSKLTALFNRNEETGAFDCFLQVDAFDRFSKLCNHAEHESWSEPGQVC